MRVLEPYALVAAGGAIGSCLRYFVGGRIAARAGLGFPWGTLVINVAGSFLLGAFLTIGLGRIALLPRWRAFFAVGLCGGFTTFSTFAWETVSLAEARSIPAAFVNVLLSTTLSLLGVLAGAALARGID